MLEARKANKVLTITEDQEGYYQSIGFDIYTVDDKGKETIKAHGAGKTVPYDKYEKVVKELEKLKAAKAKK